MARYLWILLTLGLLIVLVAFDLPPILRLGLFVPAALVVQRSDVVVRGAERGIELQRVREAYERRVVAARGLLADAQVHVREREARIDLERLREVPSRLVVAPLVQRHEAAHVPRRGQRGFHRERLLREAVRILEAADALHGGREIRPAFRDLRRDRKGHAQVRDGAAPILPLRGCDGRARMRGEIERIEGRWGGHVSFRL